NCAGEGGAMMRPSKSGGWTPATKVVSWALRLRSWGSDAMVCCLLFRVSFRVWRGVAGGLGPDPSTPLRFAQGDSIGNSLVVVYGSLNWAGRALMTSPATPLCRAW